MKRVTGIGGVFFKSKNAERLKRWYRDHLGVTPDDEGYVSFRWRDEEEPERIGRTVWEIFSAESDYFDPSDAPFMLNYRVDNLDALLDQLRREGVEVDARREDGDYGRFGWVYDPDGNKIELWEPPEEE
jgi:catechol 2,3-dioxygenase-like lactoylglutathione lyase family enzyme